MSFGGGGTDISPYPEEKGGAVLNATINKYARVFLTPRRDNRLRIKTLDYRLETVTTIENCALDGELGLVKAAVKQMDPPAGMNLLLASDVPPGSGLGASSAVTVAVLAALARWLKKKRTPEELAEEAFFVERKRALLKGGRQDQYAAVFGGLNWLEFGKDRTVVTPLPISPLVLEELQSRLLLCYTGLTRRSDLIIERQLEAHAGNKKEIVRVLDELKEIAGLMKKALLTGRLQELGDLMDRGWTVKKKLSTEITNPRVEELYAEAKKRGALGGRILGAGGGGYFLFFCERDKLAAVAEKIEESGGKAENFRFVFQGVQTAVRN